MYHFCATSYVFKCFLFNYFLVPRIIQHFSPVSYYHFVTYLVYTIQNMLQRLFVINYRLSYYHNIHIHHWCLIYIMKHDFFKKYMSISNNFFFKLGIYIL